MRGFGRVPVLAGVSADLGAGEVLLVTGSNGSGKSTLLRCLAGLLRPQAGTIRLREAGVELDMAARRRRVGYVAPDLAFYEPLTAADYRPQMLAEAMGHSSYPLQALLYAVVAHRYLRWRLRGYDPARHLGGVLYLYVRGMCGPDTPVVDGQPCGVFSWRPPVALVTELSDLLDGRDAEGAA